MIASLVSRPRRAREGAAHLDRDRRRKEDRPDISRTTVCRRVSRQVSEGLTCGRMVDLFVYILESMFDIHFEVSTCLNDQSAMVKGLSHFLRNFILHDKSQLYNNYLK